MTQIWIFVVCSLVSTTIAETVPTTTELNEITTINEANSLSDLVKKQTDAIRKILSEQKPQPAQISTTPRDVIAVKQEKEKQSIEELKLKCLNFYKTQSTTEKAAETAIPFGPPMKPEFLRPNQRLKPIQTNGNYFIFAPNPAQIYGYKSTKTDPMETAASEISEDVINYQTTTMASNEIDSGMKYKYVKLEPLILQKTMLTNGKTYFYWYKPLPNTQSFVQIPDIPENADVDTVAQPQNQANEAIPLPEKYQFYVDPHTGAITRRNFINKPPIETPQFYVNPQNGMIYQHAAPHQFIHHRRAQNFTETKPEETKPTPKPIMPTYTVEYPKTTEKYRQELRFVIPMVVANSDPSKYPFQMDPYAYYPKNQRPNLMNIAVPYVPNYQMIRTLSMPKSDNTKQ